MYAYIIHHCRRSRIVRMALYYTRHYRTRCVVQRLRCSLAATGASTLLCVRVCISATCGDRTSTPSSSPATVLRRGVHPIRLAPRVSLYNIIYDYNIIYV
jgi:hypothetical protein